MVGCRGGILLPLEIFVGIFTGRISEAFELARVSKFLFSGMSY